MLAFKSQVSMLAWALVVPAAASARKERPPIILKVSFEKHQFTQGEKPIATFTLRNNSKSAIFLNLANAVFPSGGLYSKGNRLGPSWGSSLTRSTTCGGTSGAWVPTLTKLLPGESFTTSGELRPTELVGTQYASVYVRVQFTMSQNQDERSFQELEWSSTVKIFVRGK